MNEIFKSAVKQYSKTKKKSAIIQRLLYEAKSLVLPFSLMHQDRQQTRFNNMAAMNEYYATKNLFRMINQSNPYHSIKTNLLRAGNYEYPQNKHDKSLIKRAKMTPKKFTRRMTMISADIIAAPDLIGSEHQIEMINRTQADQQ